MYQISRRWPTLAQLAAACLLIFPGVLAAASLKPSGLMCDLLAKPELTTIFNRQPNFTWIVNSPAKDDVQTAYQVRVAASAEALEQPRNCLWDSGKVDADKSTAVSYRGKPLESNHSYCWKVRTWTLRGGRSPWSEVQQFWTGVLRSERASAGAPLDQRVTVARYPIQQQVIAPVALIHLGSGHDFVDFGRDAFAALRLTISSPRDGQTMVVQMGEALQGPHHVNPDPGGRVRYYRVELQLKQGRHTYTVPLEKRDARRMSPQIGPVMPFRYVEVEDCPSPLQMNSIRQVAAHYLFDDHAAQFESSNKTLNDVWKLCRYTMKATSYAGVYVDGDRERTPYEADAYINQLGQYASDREFTLARYSGEYLIMHPTWPTEWILHSVLIAWADYMHTGDSRSLAEFYPDLKAKTLYKIEGTDGLIQTTDPPIPKSVLASIHRDEPIRDIVDWPAGERDNYDMRPVNTVVNAFHYRALVLMARIAEVMRHSDDARFFRARAARVYTAFNARFFNEKTGLYVDGEGSSHSSLHANMFALAFGLVPAQRLPKVTAFLRGRNMACSVYGAQYFLEALYRAGLAGHALALLTSHTDRSWAHMLYDVGSTITMEAWDAKYKPNLDWNHAWGAAPANIIPRLLMGVEPLAPGFRKARIRPQPGDLKWASLDLPTIRGTVHVSFQAAKAGLVVNVRLPANMTAEVDLPLQGSRTAAVLVDGVRRQSKMEGDFVAVDPVGSGSHRLEIAR